MTAAGCTFTGAAALLFLGRFFLPSPFPMYQNVWGRRRHNIDDDEDASIVSVDVEVVKEQADEKHCCCDEDA